MSYKCNNKCTPEIEKEIDIELKKDILSNTVSFKLLINGFKYYQPSARLISMSERSLD